MKVRRIRACHESWAEQAGTESSTYGIDVVYYIRRGGLIKIGTTMRLVKRLHQLRCSRDDVMAVEFGGRELERMRHAQFAHLLAKGREYFHPAPELLDHVAEIANDMRRAASESVR